MSELDVQRGITRAFILTQPLDVILTPRERTATDTGGIAYVEQAPRDSQVMRIIEPPSPNAPFTTQDGRQLYVQFMLLGEWDADIGLYDTFGLRGKYWEIVQLYWNNQYEVRAEVAQYG